MFLLQSSGDHFLKVYLWTGLTGRYDPRMGSGAVWKLKAH
jgi:hypothetical protein